MSLLPPRHVDDAPRASLDSTPSRRSVTIVPSDSAEKGINDDEKRAQEVASDESERQTAEPRPGVDDYPEGGARAWLVVLGVRVTLPRSRHRRPDN